MSYAHCRAGINRVVAMRYGGIWSRRLHPLRRTLADTTGRAAMTLSTRLAAQIDAALDALEASGDLPAGLSRATITLEPPRDTARGDFASNAALALAKPAQTNPRALAEQIAAPLRALDGVASVSIAGAGFINLRLTDDIWRGELLTIHDLGDDYGRSNRGAGRTVTIDYRAAHPTAPLQMRQWRGAVLGDALAALLAFAGHAVVSRYRGSAAGGAGDHRGRIEGDLGLLGIRYDLLCSDGELEASDTLEAVEVLIAIRDGDQADPVERLAVTRQARTGGKARFDVKRVGMVRPMRAGDCVTLADVVDAVGKDVIRFTMLTRKPDVPMDFDFAKVVEASSDNPVFAVGYAHIRIAALRRRAAEAGIGCDSIDLSQLDTEDLALVRLAAHFPRIVEIAAAEREPHRIALYLHDLAAALHAVWSVGNDRPERGFVLPDNPAMTCARLFLADAIGQIIRNGLGIMGVQALQEMN